MIKIANTMDWAEYRKPKAKPYYRLGGKHFFKHGIIKIVVTKKTKTK